MILINNKGEVIMIVTVREFWSIYQSNKDIELENGVTLGFGSLWSKEGAPLNDNDIINIIIKRA